MVVVGAIVILWFRDCDTICPWLWASDYDGSRRSRRAVGSFSSLKTLAHSPKAGLAVMIVARRSSR